MKILSAGKWILGAAIGCAALFSCRNKPTDRAWIGNVPVADASAPHVSLRERLKSKNSLEIPHVEIHWHDLLLLDYKRAKVPAKLKELESRTVKLAGFIVPLTDDYGPFDEFLIVPDQMACIHAPPPPPNQMLYVKTKKDLPIELTFYPLWFYGRLSVLKTDSIYGSIGYGFKLQKLELYEKEE